MHRSFLASLLLAPSAVFATQATQPGTRPASTQALQATITGVEGIVQVRPGEDQPWRPAQVGMTVDEGAEFRTGPRSAVRFQLPPDQVVTLDRLGTVKLVEAVRGAGLVKTDLGMRYGRVRYDIEAAGVQHDATIHSPGSTLAVRGTRVSLTNTMPFPPVATSLTGRARFSAKGKSTTLGGTGKATIEEGADGAAETAIGETFVDPGLPGARGPGEELAILNLPVIAAFAGQSSLSLQSVQQPAPPEPLPVQITQGNLFFQLVWIQTQSTSSTPDIDLHVFTPFGEELCPKDCIPIDRAGGISPTDDTGGGKLEAGQEIAAWQSRFPLGQYRVAARHVSGAAAEFQIVVVRDGQVVGQPVSGSVSNGNTQQFNIPVTGPAPATASGRTRVREAARKDRERSGVAAPLRNGFDKQQRGRR